MKLPSHIYLGMALKLNRKGKEICSECVRRGENTRNPDLCGNENCKMKKALDHSLQILEDISQPTASV